MSRVVDGSVWQFSSINWHGLLEKGSVGNFFMLPSSREDEVMFEIPFMAALLRQRDKYATRSTLLWATLHVPLGDVVRLTDTKVRTMCPAPEVNEGIAVERANGTSEIVLTSPTLSIIVAASAVIAAHLHMDDPRVLDPIR